jgi:hypothetical protein
MSDTIRPARTETYEHTITGLLKKRVALFNEAEAVRNRMGEIRNDIDAIDRVLGTLGYTGDLDSEMPRQKVHRVFGKGELTRAILGELRGATGPVGSREIAQGIVAANEKDGRDRKFVTDVTRRASKALRILREEGVVRSSVDARGNVRWILVVPHRGG